MYHNFIHSSVNGHLGCFHVLAIVSSVAMNNEIHVSFSTLVSSGYMPRSGITGSCGGFIPSVLKNLHTLFHSGYINLHSHQQYKSIPFSSHLFKDLFFVDFLTMASLTGVRCYMILDLICISVIMRNVFSHLYVFFEEIYGLVFSPLFDCVICFSGIELYEILVYFGN